MESMKKFLCVLLILLGVGVVVYILTHKKDEVRLSWDETLAQVPTPSDLN